MNDIITLDFIEQIKISKKNKPINNLHALNYLSAGLFQLAIHLRSIEKSLSKTTYGSVTFSMGELPYMDYVTCYFNWFGVTLVNYVRLVGLLDIMNRNDWKTQDIKNNKNKIKKYCNKYIKEVIPEVYFWRNKVAAHSAATDPFSDDNIATLEMSLLYPLSFSNSHYYVGEFQWGGKDGDSNMPKWSLIEIYIKLIPRYWPHVKINEDGFYCNPIK